MSENHTPGPWQVNGSYIYSPDPERAVLVAIHNSGSKETDSNLEANAKLIATGPDLLAALQRIVNDVPGPGEDAILTTDGYNQACKAIAKALG